MIKEKIIQALKCCSQLYSCYDCPFRSELRPKPIKNPCTQLLAQEVLNLLKEYSQLIEVDIND